MFYQQTSCDAQGHSALRTSLRMAKCVAETCKRYYYIYIFINVRAFVGFSYHISLFDARLWIIYNGSNHFFTNYSISQRHIDYSEIPKAS
jgi:hypothetical protein